jgi:nitroimidazol reductase NimA-like FMN-containing flavoprotein (pyridoxamine 5'-phosphate oxidase superfamily)
VTRGAPKELYSFRVDLPVPVCRLLEAGATIGHLATSYHGAPYVTPVWLDLDQVTGHILIDVKPEAVKLRNVRSNPQICLSLVSPHNSSMWAVIRGKVTDIDDLGSDVSHVQMLADRYLGRPKRTPGLRFILRIKATQVRWWGENAYYRD